MNGLEIEVFSVIRQTHRPAILSLHALIAVYFMLELLSDKSFSKDFSIDQKEYLSARKIELKKQYISGSFALKDVPWTSLGGKIFSEMFDEVTGNN